MSFEEFPQKKEIGIKEKYLTKTDSEGFVFVGAFSREELKRQTKNVAAFLDGDENTNPDANLGANLKYKGSSGNYTDMKIHIDDLEEFIKRVRDYYGE